jgi:hypothetical protein
MTATIVDDSITVYCSGAQMMKAMDSTCASGNPGCGFFSRTPAANSDLGFSGFTATGL